MLKHMRTGAKSPLVKTLLFGLLLLAMGGLALIGDGSSMFRESLRDDTIATIGREKLKAQAFDRIVQNVLREQQMKQSEAYRAHVPLQILKQDIINPRIFALAAGDAGLRVDDVLAAEQVKEMIAPLVAKGMSKQDALNQTAQAQNTNESGLVAAIKAQIAIDQLVNTVSSGITAPQQLVDDALKFRNEYRNGEYFRLTLANAGKVEAPSNAELESYYNSISSDYSLPEYRTLSVLILDKKILGDTVKVSPERLKEYYEENIAEYKTGETRVISQVVAPDEAAAKAIYEEARKNKDLQAASKSQGKGSYIMAQPYTEKEIASELSEAAFSGKAGEILPPVKSALGWHVINIQKITPPSTKSFDSVKADIEKELMQDKVSEALYQFANKIDDEIGSGKSLSDVAKENKISETVLTKIDSHGVDANGKKAGANLPILDKLVTTGFSLTKGAASQLIETPEGAFAIVGVSEIYPAEQQPISKVRDKVLARWMTDHQLKALSEKAAKVLDRLKEGEAFSKVAGEFSEQVHATGPVLRTADPLKAKLESNLIASLFSLDKVGQATSFSSDNTVTIIRLAGRNVKVSADTSKKDAEDMASILSRSLKQDLLEQYRLSLLDKYNVKINERLLSSMYAPKSNNSGGDVETGE